MNFDLNVTVGRTQTTAQRVAMRAKLRKLGFEGMAWNRNVFGRLQNSDTSNLPQMLREMEVFERSRPGANTGDMKQLSRITLYVDDIAETQVLTGGNNVLQSYDILAVCPSNMRTFNYVCANADVDIILVDYSRKIPFHMPKKAVDIALKRGICLEILYAPTIKDTTGRRCTFSGATRTTEVTKGRMVIFSSGADESAYIRGPADVRNLARVMGFPSQSLPKLLRENVYAVLRHAAARKLRYLPAEVCSTEEFRQKYELDVLELNPAFGKIDDVDDDEEEGDEDESSAAEAGLESKGAEATETKRAEQFSDDEDDGMLMLPPVSARAPAPAPASAPARTQTPKATKRVDAAADRDRSHKKKKTR